MCLTVTEVQHQAVARQSFDPELVVPDRLGDLEVDIESCRRRSPLAIKQG